MTDETLTDLDNAREAWSFEREHWDGHGPSIRYDKATLALINALESDLARVTKERDELRAAIVEWDEVESMDPEELTDDNLNQISEWYMRHLAACDRLSAIVKGSAL